MIRISKITDKFFRCLIGSLFFLIVIMLWGGSIFGNCMVNNDEYTYYISDQPLIHVLAFFSLVVMLYFYRTKIGRRTDCIKLKKIVFWICLFLYFSITLFCALYVSMEPRADQKSVVDTVQAMLNGDFSAFKANGYVGVYPNQVGIVYLLYWMFRVLPFGYKTMVVINVFSLVIIIYYMAAIGKVLSKECGKKWMSGIVTMMFFPITMYATFVYGNMLGQALSTVAIYYTLVFLEKHSILSIVTATITAAISVTIKENFIIPVVGIIIFLVLDFFRKKSKKSIVFLCSLLIITLGMGSIVKIHMQNITGEKISKGVPTLAWVVMGMQEGYMAYGWHNQYNENVYRENGCDSEKTTKQVTEDFKARLGEFVSKPAYAVKFFYQKTLSQWNNPTFECYWINDLTKREKDGIKVKPLSGFLGSLAGEPGNSAVTVYCNIFQSLLLLGVVLWVLLGRKQIEINQLLLATIFVGGFVFHLFWEAKCQYVIPYLVLLIPYCVRGYQLLLDKVELVFEKNSESNTEQRTAKRIIGIIVCVTFVIVLIGTVGNKIVDKAFGFSESGYEEFLNSK